jgi:Cu+-exporting ATPase
MMMHPQPKKEDPKDLTREAVVVDPVCGMPVNPETADSCEYNGQTYYLCSTRCLDRFRDDPEGFLNKLTALKASQSVGIRHESKPAASPIAQTYTCPIHSEVRQDKPGSCPRCGMALKPVSVTAPQKKVEYTCPMHPEIVRDAPGNCPICGMALEPRTVTLTEEENHELKDMRRRFWVSVAFTIPLFVIGMSDFIPGAPLQRFVASAVPSWIQLTLASPVVLWGGWPFFVRFGQSLVNRSLNMFTLIGLGVGVAYGYSVVATLFPESFRIHFVGTAAPFRFTSNPPR